MRYMSNKDIITAEIAAELGMLSMDKGSYYVVDSIGKDVWEAISEFTTVDEIVNKMLEIYDVDSKVCEKDVTTLLNKMVNMGLVIEE